MDKMITVILTVCGCVFILCGIICALLIRRGRKINVKSVFIEDDVSRAISEYCKQVIGQKYKEKGMLPEGVAFDMDYTGYILELLSDTTSAECKMFNMEFCNYVEGNKIKLRTGNVGRVIEEYVKQKNVKQEEQKKGS